MLERNSLKLTTLGNGNTITWGSLNSNQQEEFTDLGKSLGYKYVLNSISFDRVLGIGDEFKVKTLISNYGNVPTYENWTTNLRFTNTSDSSKTFTVELEEANFTKLFPTYDIVRGINDPSEFIDTKTVPSNITTGTYNIELFIPQPNRNNLRLYNLDTNATNSGEPSLSDGVYPSGSVQILEEPTISEDEGTNGGGGGAGNYGTIICGPADIDNDGKFTFKDQKNFASKYKYTCSDSETYGSCRGVDLNDDKIVDYVLFSLKYGENRNCD